MKKTIFTIIASVTLALSTPALAQRSDFPGSSTANKQASNTDEVEAGWFFFKDPPPPEEEEEDAPAPPPKKEPKKEEEKEQPKEKKCSSAKTWSVDCGFINPGTDFEFQSKQRDALMQRMALANNDPKAVEAFQYYMRWVLERTTEVTNNWWYNMVQNPELDPTVTEPISAFGLRLMTDVQKGHADEIFKLIKSEGGFFIYFSRNDCAFCHQMGQTIKRLSKSTGLTVRNAALDDTCMAGFEVGCMTAPATLGPAQALQVTIVPTLFLHLPPKTWLRVTTGVSDEESLKTRTVQFFSAYRNALLKGVENGTETRPSVDFSGTLPTGTVKGVERLEKEQLPDEASIKNMLGAGGR